MRNQRKQPDLICTCIFCGAVSNVESDRFFVTGYRHNKDKEVRGACELCIRLSQSVIEVNYREYCKSIKSALKVVGKK